MTSRAPRNSDTDAIYQNAPAAGDFDDDADHAQSWSETSRVRVVGYHPDLDPLQPSAPIKTVTLMPTPSYGAIDSPSTPVLALVEQEGVARGLQKYFREGSVRGSVFNLCSATLGAGALALPAAFKQAGLALGITLLFVGAVATIFSIRLLVKSRERTNLKSYEDLTVALFGKKMGIIVELNIIAFCFGTAVAYCKAVGDILSPVISLANGPSWLDGKVATVLFWFIVMLPLSMLKSMNSLRFSSLFGVVTILYLVLATVLHCLLYADFSHTKWDSSDLWVNPSFSSIVQAAPIVIFAFTCQVNVFAIYDELERANSRRMARVTDYAIFVCISIYVLMGVFGFLEFRDDTCSNILKNFRDDVEKKHNAMIIAAYICITMTILMAFPLVIFPCRYTVEVMLESHTTKEILSKGSTSRHLVLTLLISGSALVLSLLVPNISVVFQLTGGTTSAFVCFVLPAAFAIKLDLCRRSRFKMGCTWLLAVGGGVVGATSTVLTVIDLIKGGGGGC